MDPGSSPGWQMKAGDIILFFKIIFEVWGVTYWTRSLCYSIASTRSMPWMVSFKTSSILLLSVSWDKGHPWQVPLRRSCTRPRAGSNETKSTSPRCSASIGRTDSSTCSISCSIGDADVSLRGRKPFFVCFKPHIPVFMSVIFIFFCSRKLLSL